MGCPHCDPTYHGPPVPNHCKHWPDLTEENCALCADAHRIEALKAAREALDYSLLDVPEKECDSRIWNANMKAYRLITDVLNRHPC